MYRQAPQRRDVGSRNELGGTDLSIQENELLTRVGPATPMGDLMRRYWHPVAAAAELDASSFRTKEVRILGEDLVLCKDRSGRLGLIDRWCAHRRVNLSYGVVEEDGLRCQYHGWKYDTTGACIEQPFEETVHPDGRFREKCGLVGYRVQELAGLVFAYMGPQPAPLLPRWEPVVWDNAVRHIAITELPCNWLQCQENSLDPVHTEWLHGYLGEHLMTLQGVAKPRRFGGRNRHQRIGFDVFKHGIIKRRIANNTAIGKISTEEDDGWKIGHPILFPNILLVGNQFSCTMQFRVPVDDEHTFHVSLYTWNAAPGTQAPKQESVPVRITQLFDEENRWILDSTFNQDFMVWSTQGPLPIAQRNREKLGESDKGIVLFRKLLKQQVELIQEGGEPMNTFRDPAENVSDELPLEDFTIGLRGVPQRYVPGEQGYSADGEKIEETLATWRTPSESRA